MYWEQKIGHGFIRFSKSQRNRSYTNLHPQSILSLAQHKISGNEALTVHTKSTAKAIQLDT